MTSDIEAAKVRCRAEGMDPEFIGTKGYPNWHLFTDAARMQTQRFLQETDTLIGLQQREEAEAIASLDLAIGKTLWFIDSAEDDEHSNVYFIFSGVIESITQNSMIKIGAAADREFYVTFVGAENGMTFYAGHQSYRNRTFFATRGQAQKEVRSHQKDGLSAAAEQLKMAQQSLERAEHQLEASILETTAKVAMNYGFRYSTLCEAMAAQEV